MTIQEMFEREDIYTIIENTLSYYYKATRNKKVNAKICKKAAFKKILIYPRLGVIIPLFPSKEVRNEVYALFDVQRNIIKKIIAKTYITICFASFGVMANSSLLLSDDSVFDRNTLIIPGNRKIRIYNFSEGYIDSVVKEGFNDFYYNNEINIRENYHLPFILGILDKGERAAIH